MASIHKQSGRAYWFASYRDANRKYHFVSTKIAHTPPGKDAKERTNAAAHNRRLAQDMATRLEEAEIGNATESHLRKLLADMSERVNQSRMVFQRHLRALQRHREKLPEIFGREVQCQAGGHHGE
jgi:hypothetical protein